MFILMLFEFGRVRRLHERGPSIANVDYCHVDLNCLFINDSQSLMIEGTTCVFDHMLR